MFDPRLILQKSYKKTSLIITLLITSLGINAVVSHTFENIHTKTSRQASSYAGCFENMSTISQLNFVPVNISVDFRFPETCTNHVRLHLFVFIK